MITQTLQVFSLRGMDERWIVDPQDALYIQDMTWTSNDSWRSSGGIEQKFIPLQPPEPPSDTQPAAGDEEEDLSTVTRKPVYGEINSIHWFAQHNGARQWLIYEEENFELDSEAGEFVTDKTVSLKVFDGSLSKPNSFTSPAWLRDGAPSRTLRQYSEKEIDYASSIPVEDTKQLVSRSKSELSTRTQSQSYGGRIYLVNGYDEPLVFDGSICERAGFAEKPPAPSAFPASSYSSTTFPIALGDYGQPDLGFMTIKVMGVDYNVGYKGRPRSVGYFSLHKDLPYWGLGSRSSATVGAGSYRFTTKITSMEVPYLGSEFPTQFALRLNYFGREQFDTRQCGYQYRVTFVNDRGQESEASQSSSIVSVYNGTGGKKRAFHGKCMINVTIPIGPKECVARRVYRTRNVYDSNGDLYTKGDQQQYYFLTEIQDNMTDQFVDGHPDSALGDLLDLRDLGNFPAQTKFLAVFKNTMFAAGTDLNEIRYSAPLFPEVFPKDHVIIVGDDDGGPITGMRATKNALVVFKSRGIYLIKGSPATGFAAQTLNKDIGCIAPNSIAEIPGLGLAFLSEKSVCLLEGALENTGSPTGVVNIGAEIPNQLELINLSAAIRSSSVVYQRDKEYWLSVPTMGSDKNNLCLIYHYEVGSWSIRKDFPIDCMVVSKDHRGYLFIGSNDNENDNNTGILVYGRGFDSKGLKTTSRYEDGTAKDVEKVPINSIYETVSNDYQSVFTNFRPAHVMAYAVGYGNNGLNVNTRVNRSIDQVRTTVQTAEQQDPNETYPVYGSAEFGVDRWIPYRPTVVRYDVSTSHKGPVRELSISFASADGNKIEIIGYDLEAKVGEQRSIKPLNKALRPSRR